MFWLTLIVGMQFLGFGITLGRLAYDEWQQWRLSTNAQKVDWGSPDLEKVEAMENSTENVIPIKGGANAYRFINPLEVVRNATLDLDEKRAILAAWASDEHAVESKPTLRYLPGTPAPVTFTSIMDARALLDSISQAANDDDPPPLLPTSRKCNRNFYLEAA